jgi:hypothetical protein
MTNRRNIRQTITFLLVFSLLTSCVTGASSSSDVSLWDWIFPHSDKRGHWGLNEEAIQPAWTEDDLKIPVALAGLPDDPPKVFLLDGIPKPGDQGGQANGTAWAVGYTGLSHIFRTKKSEPEYLCSPAFIYNQLNDGKDAGIEMIAALTFIVTNGCSAFEKMPYIQSDYMAKPSLAAFNSAGEHRAKGFARVDFTDIAQVKAHLLQGSPVIVTMRIAENFLDFDDEAYVPYGEGVGRHTIVVIGFNDDKNQFIIQNSAGEEWGEGGRAGLPYAWFLRLTSQAYVIW